MKLYEINLALCALNFFVVFQGLIDAGPAQSPLLAVIGVINFTIWRVYRPKK